MTQSTDVLLESLAYEDLLTVAKTITGENRRMRHALERIATRPGRYADGARSIAREALK